MITYSTLNIYLEYLKNNFNLPHKKNLFFSENQEIFFCKFESKIESLKECYTILDLTEKEDDNRIRENFNHVEDSEDILRGAYCGCGAGIDFGHTRSRTVDRASTRRNAAG